MINCGQVWWTNFKTKIEKLTVDTPMIILSRDRTNGTEYWRCANFGLFFGPKSFGGGIQLDLTDQEIFDNAIFVGWIGEKVNLPKIARKTRIG